MTAPTYSSFAQWYSEGLLASYVRNMKSPGSILHLIEAEQPPGNMSDPAVPDLVLYQDLSGGSRVIADLGAGRFDTISWKGALFLAAPNFANHVTAERHHSIRSLSFPVSRWQTTIEEAVDASFSFDFRTLYQGPFTSPRIGATIRKLWELCDEEGMPSRLLAQAAGCEILAELCRMAGKPLVSISKGLAPWAERHAVDMLHSNLAEDISLDDLAAEVHLSTFHFARMFKQSTGVPPRVYLTRLRVERACELLELTDLPVTEIAHEVGYSSNQVLARVFMKHRGVSPGGYRRATRGGTTPGPC